MNSCNKCAKQNTCTKAKSIENYGISGCMDFVPFGAVVCSDSYKRKREFGEPIRMYLVEEDRLLALLELEHRFVCRTQHKDDQFEYFWDMMVESGLDQHVSHKEFIEAVENMTFEKLAEMDLALYEEYEDKCKKCIYEFDDVKNHQ